MRPAWRIARLLVLLALLPWVATAGMSSWTSGAFRNDPARCSATDGGPGEVCAPGPISAALDEFRYWNHQASGEGGGTHWFLGRSQGVLWSISCNHCGVTAPQRNFTRGPWSGQVFESVNFDDVVRAGAYRQFNKKSGLPGGSQEFRGDVLYRYQAKAGETLPEVPMMSVLEDLDDLEDGTLMLSAGAGDRQTHDRLGWFRECAATAGGGGPAKHTCCEPARSPAQYAPDTRPQGTASVPFSDSVKVAYGGEGDFAACRAAGLSYLGPVWTKHGSVNWATWEFRRSFVAEYGPNPDGLRRLDILPAVWNPTVIALQLDNPVSRGLCATAQSSIPGGYKLWAPARNLVKTQLACSFDRVTGRGRFAMVRGDSGAATWAYLPKRPRGDRWVFVGAGQSLVGKTLNLVVNRADFERWVLGVGDSR
jgi:hypothetical protein